jgi:hypothetical protein
MEIETLKTMNDGMYPGLMMILEVIALITVFFAVAGIVICLAGIAWLCLEETRRPPRRQIRPAPAPSSGGIKFTEAAVTAGNTQQKPASQTSATVFRKVYMPRTQILLLLFLSFSLTGCGKSASAARQELAQMNIPFTEAEFLETARQGNSTAASLFIDAGINVEAKDSVGQTALMTATLANQLETVKVLLAQGADPNATDKFGGTALMTAAWKGNKEIALSLLAHDADLNAKANNGMTALMFAAWENHTQLSKVLLEKGADPGLKDQNGWTASMRADFKGHTQVANLLKVPQGY